MCFNCVIIKFFLIIVVLRSVLKSEQRRKYLKHPAEKELNLRKAPVLIHIHIYAVLQALLKISFHIRHRGSLIKVDRILKMEIQASEVQVHCPNNSLLSVRYKFLRMDKARSVLVDLNAVFNEHRIVGVSQPEGIGLVRDVGEHYLYVHSPL